MDEHIDAIDPDEISKLRAGPIETRSWWRSKCYVFKADMEVKHGDPTAVRLIYRAGANRKLLREKEIILGTCTLRMRQGQREGTAEWVTEDGQRVKVEWDDPSRHNKGLARPEQTQFRAQTLALFESTCAVTGCKVEEVLEAAHVVPLTEGGGYAPDNGILLRRDIHTLFDDHRLAIHPNSLKVKLAKRIADDYGKYEGVVVDLPKGGPKARNLDRRWKRFSG